MSVSLFRGIFKQKLLAVIHSRLTIKQTHIGTDISAYIYIYARIDTYISVQNWKAINSEIYLMLHCTSLIAGLVNCRANNTLRQKDLQAKIKSFEN